MENVQRSDLTALEEAEAYKHLREEFGLTQEEIAERVGKTGRRWRTPSGS